MSSPRPARRRTAAARRSAGAARPRHTAGFTLLEVLVAVAVMGVVALLLHHGFAELRRLADRASAVRSGAARSAAVRRQLTSWLRGVYVDPAVAERFEGARGQGGPGAGDRLAFWTGGGWEEGSTHVALALEPGAGLVARVTGGGAADGAAERIVLVSGADTFQARYFVDLGAERVWVKEWSSGVTAPVGVELRIDGRAVHPLLRVPVLVGYGG